MKNKLSSCAKSLKELELSVTFDLSKIKIKTCVPNELPKTLQERVLESTTMKTVLSFFFIIFIISASVLLYFTSHGILILQIFRSAVGVNYWSASKLKGTIAIV